MQENIKNKKFILSQGNTSESEINRISHLISNLEYTQENLAKELRLKLENIKIDVSNIQSEIASFKSKSFLMKIKFLFFGK